MNQRSNHPVTHVAVLGCGKRGADKEGWAIGHAHARGYLDALPNAALHGVDPNPENLAAFGERFNVPAERLFPSTAALYQAVTPDVVSVCTWPGLHRAMTIEAVKAGVRGVICEKPMAVDGSEVRDMLAAAERAGAVLAVAHQRAYDGPYVAAKRVLDEGQLGSDLVLEARVGDGWDMLSWSVHWFDLAAWLFGADAVAVTAGMACTDGRRYHHAVEDSSVVFVEFPDNRQGIFITGPHAPGGTRVIVRGSEGMMRIRPDGLSLWTRGGYQELPPATVALSGFSGLVREVVDAIEHEAPVRCDARRSSKATLLAFAAQESARTLKRIALPTDVQYPPLEIVQRAPEPRRLGRVVVVADAHHHDAQTGLSGRDGLVEAVRSLKPASLHLVKADERELTGADLDGADLLVVYHTQRQSTPATRQALSAWMGAGKPLAVMHCGIGAYSDWPEFREWIGLHWVWQDEPGDTHSGHPHEPCAIEVVDDRFPVSWTAAWLPRDEVYIRLGQASEVRLLANARMNESVFPVAWQSTRHPRVAVWAPGHRADIWRLPVMRDGLRATIELVTHAHSTAPSS